MDKVTITLAPNVSSNERNAIVNCLTSIGGFTCNLNESPTTITTEANHFITLIQELLSNQPSAPQNISQISHPQISNNNVPLNQQSRPTITSPTIFTKLSLSFPSPLVYNHNAVINIAGDYIPDELLLVVSLGKKFVPPIPFDRERILLDLSKLVDRQEMDRKLDGDLLKEAITFIKAYTPKPMNDLQEHVIHVFKVAKEFLDNNPNVCVSPADKGNISVIFEKRFYEEKMHEHLSSDVYQKIGTSSHLSLIKRNHALLTKLSATGFLGKRLISHIASQETQIPMIYGVWKPFKNFSLRPIMSSVKSVGGKLFHEVVEILNRLDKDNEYSLVNTTQMIDQVKTLALTHDDRLFSIDMVSMFTNIQPELALSIIFPKLPTITNLNPELFREIFFFVTKIATEFGCEGGTFKQVSGLPMGTEGSPVIASIVFTHFLNSVLPKHAPVAYLKKYVDDTIMITSQANAHAILTSLNNIDRRIQFTMEEENDSSGINFLDVSLFRREQKIITKWYCKPFSSNRLVNWFSEHEPHTISNTAVRYISNMLFYSHISFHDELMQKAKVILFKNSFPSDKIDDFIIKAKEIVAFNIFGENDAENTQFLSTLAPIRVLKAINHLCHSNRSNVKYVNTYLDHNSGSTIFSHLKDPQAFENQNNLVVRVSCKSCKYFRFVPIITPLVLYRALNIPQLFHPFSPITSHISSTKHAGFRTKIERSCSSRTMTIHATKALCKKNGITCPI